MSDATKMVRLACAAGLALIGAMAAAQSPAPTAGELDCAVATELAKRSYTRALDQMKLKNRQIAFELRLPFWDIYEYGCKCRGVVSLASALSAYGLQRDAKVAPASFPDSEVIAKGDPPRLPACTK